jgi:hypothetical protein
VKNCPRCDAPVDGIECGRCGHSEARPGSPTSRHMAPEAKRAYESGGHKVSDLTDEQWYNVCKFWPSVAARSGRKIADVGVHNPLDASAARGPLLRRINRALPVVEREPGQEG